MVKNPQANAILECVHQVLGQMLRNSEPDMADSVSPDDIDVFLDNACSLGHFHVIGHGILAGRYLANFFAKGICVNILSYTNRN